MNLHRFHDGGVSVEPSEIHDVEHGVRIRTSGDYVPVEDLLLPSWLEFEAEGDEAGPSSFGRVEVRKGRPELVEFRVWSRPGEPEVKHRDLRQAEPAALVDLLAGFALQVFHEDGRRIVWYPEPGSEQQAQVVAQVRGTRVGNRRLTHGYLERVAEVYRANLASGPTLAVQRHFVVSPRMASGYVQRARRAGLLPPTTPGKKKG